MSKPSYDEISVKAYQIWEARGHPPGVDAEIWFQAERELGEASPKSENLARNAKSEPGQSVPSHAISPTPVEQKVLVTEIQKQQARAPQVPHHTGPAAKPAETGKPVWPKARSA